MNFKILEHFKKKEVKVNTGTFYCINTKYHKYFISVNKKEFDENIQDIYDVVENLQQRSLNEKEFVTFDKELIKTCYFQKKPLDKLSNIYYIEKVNSFSLRLKDINFLQEIKINYIII